MRKAAEQAEEQTLIAAARAQEQRYQQRVERALKQQPPSWHGLRKADVE